MGTPLRVDRVDGGPRAGLGGQRDAEARAQSGSAQWTYQADREWMLTIAPIALARGEG
ncbi:MAG TPA: hypothetical protein VG736_10525 [Vicinamibacterales bacterium]|nr:hypothetical protein [Vicinamibacterales bacterium]